MEILVKIQNNYGCETVYPVCKTAQIFAQIAGTKTLTPETRCAIKQLGYELKVEVPKI